MARRSSKYPTELELEILKVLWQHGTCGVREVREALAGRRDLAHTSVMTVMGIMTRKGYLTKRREGNRHVYSAAITQEKTSSGMLGDLVDRVFEGSTATAALQLLETGDLDDDELKQLSDLIRRKEQGRSS